MVVSFCSLLNRPGARLDFGGFFLTKPAALLLLFRLALHLMTNSLKLVIGTELGQLRLRSGCTEKEALIDCCAAPGNAVTVAKEGAEDKQSG